ncbi:septum formation protein Maf [Flavipsychrobacter stenotrophus]|uniref:dTTP/UTP pyrophosphatase n=1 Tax=Flavipsychrobacter stenotrophus TaxID=2077091 RepID=A0A2S7STI3_9BACT|nr:septum formation protein Maf [Flavipsychrobacter stenotrophus]
MAEVHNARGHCIAYCLQLYNTEYPVNKIILASQSPRRKQLMEMAELQFEVIIADVDETPPVGMPGKELPVYLAKKKADAIAHKAVGAIVIAADTVVLLDDDILNKPTDAANAVDMLSRLSGRMHTVVTGVCIRKDDKEQSFSITTEVYFRKLSTAQIEHYVSNYKPFDKAGAYAIQEWIGVTGIEQINGDYYNVMGLPIGSVLEVLEREF